MGERMREKNDSASLRSAEPLWTVQGVADYLAVSRAMVYRLPLRFIRIGSDRRYDPADVRLYVANQTTRQPAKKVG